MDRESLDALGKVIREAGFDAFAVMPARPSGQMLAILRQAQEEGRYPEFVDPDVEKRVDPRNLQQSAKAVIALAVSYNTGPPVPFLPCTAPSPVPPGDWIITASSRSAWKNSYAISPSTMEPGNAAKPLTPVSWWTGPWPWKRALAFPAATARSTCPPLGPGCF